MDKDWIDNITETVFKVTKKTSRNVNYVYNIKKTEIEIARVNHEIGKIYKSIGEVVYNAREEESDSSNIEILCKQIDVKKEYIKELEKRIACFKEEKNLEGEELIFPKDKPSYMTEDKKITVPKEAPVIKIKLKENPETGEIEVDEN